MPITHAKQAANTDLINQTDCHQPHPTFPLASIMCPPAEAIMAPAKHFIDHEGEEDLMALFPDTYQNIYAIGQIPTVCSVSALADSETDEVELLAPLGSLSVRAGPNATCIPEGPECLLVLVDDLDGLYSPDNRTVSAYHFAMGGGFGGAQVAHGEQFEPFERHSNGKSSDIDEAEDDTAAAMDTTTRRRCPEGTTRNSDSLGEEEGAAFLRPMTATKRTRSAGDRSQHVSNKLHRGEDAALSCSKQSVSQQPPPLVTTIYRHQHASVLGQLCTESAQAQMAAMANSTLRVLAHAMSVPLPNLFVAANASTPHALRSITPTTTPSTRHRGAAASELSLPIGGSAIKASFFADADLFVNCLMAALSKATSEEEVCGLVLLLAPSQCPAVGAALSRCDCRLITSENRSGKFEGATLNNSSSHIHKPCKQTASYSFAIFHQFTTFLEVMRFDLVPHDVLYSEASSGPQVLHHPKEQEARRYLASLRQLIVSAALDYLQHFSPSLANEIMTALQRVVMRAADVPNARRSALFSVPSLACLSAIVSHRYPQLRMALTYAINTHLQRAVKIKQPPQDLHRWLKGHIYGASQVFSSSVLTEKEIANVIREASAIALREKHLSLPASALTGLLFASLWMTVTNTASKKASVLLKPLVGSLGSEGMSTALRTLENTVRSLPIAQLISRCEGHVGTSPLNSFSSAFLSSPQTDICGPMHRRPNTPNQVGRVQVSSVSTTAHSFLRDLVATLSVIRAELGLSSQLTTCHVPCTPKSYGGHSQSSQHDATPRAAVGASPLRWTFLYNQTPTAHSKQVSPVGG